ncbi:hypothetical protein [Rathayibacter iranicus]|uniref:Uncharacterized protein n=2 Tax=Rathayibacter iranicus TaxID=59737 RepID=A0AAD1EKX8_9MICO|nr:hypothetical protein [Rathayibacter iranicus]AZZ54478.1 hypothetical protein C7V51_00165 [Rathayibacter iranicus]MWV29898.1 hypothetical protein [Rathayibacter iranicus NCPPB 2253 = VKM Ac-1602]PPI51653.1 hypothetical protein C5E09_00225 [Rathayibacter iranicus]PPI63821.1 hypothetical protein C5E08_00225 [Rathayibacter iranicus]PPI74667.1 hypothetical protein C5E01_00225 [Rathayibacter iranicus]
MNEKIPHGDTEAYKDASSGSDVDRSRKGRGITLVALAVSAVGLAVVRGGTAETWFDYCTTIILGILALVLLITGVRALRMRQRSR